MNKFAKGSLAAGAGIVLLLGGAGTLAYWNSEVELSGGSINTGQLDLATSEVTAPDAPALWVPGDEVTYTTNLLLTAEGDNLEGEIVLDADSVDLAGEGADAITLSVEPGTGALPTGVEYDEALGGFRFANLTGTDAHSIPVEITVSFPFGDEADNSSQSATVDLSEVSFVATQTDPEGN
jgi:alternate signal-mediated exported protein